MRRSRPYRILLQAYDGREPNFAVRKLPFENYRLFKKVEKQRGWFLKDPPCLFSKQGLVENNCISYSNQWKLMFNNALQMSIYFGKELV